MSSPTNSTCDFVQDNNVFDLGRLRKQSFDESTDKTSKMLEVDRFDSLDDFSPGPKLGSLPSTKFFSLSESASSSSPHERKAPHLASTHSSMLTSSSEISSPPPLKSILKKRTDDFASFGHSFGSIGGSPLAFRSATLDPSITRETGSNSSGFGLFLPISSRQADSEIWLSTHSAEFQTPKGSDGKPHSFASDNIRDERVAFEESPWTSERSFPEGKVGFDDNSTTYEYEPVHLSSLEMDAMFPERDSDLGTP